MDNKTRSELAAKLAAAQSWIREVEEALRVTEAGRPTPPSPTPQPQPTGLREPAKFYDSLRAGKFLGPAISAKEFEGCEALLRACVQYKLPIAQVAYVFGTAWLETNGTMQPVREAYWLDDKAREAYLFRMYDIEGARPDKAKELGNIHPGDGVKFGGVGFVQSTGRSNAQKLGKVLGLPLEEKPELMERADVAATAMVVGMRDGLFTGRPMSRTLPARGPATHAQFKVSRPIVNGTDRDGDVADAAVAFQTALQAGAWEIEGA